jgi:hypothetical protein
MTIYGFHKLTSTLKSMENVGSDDRYFEGLLTVQMKDKQGEVTIVDELYKVLPVWIDRGAPISDTHSNRIVGKGINYSRTTVKNDEGHELPAIKITGKIFKNYELDNVIWNKIKNNEYKGLSFGGATRSARSPIKMKDGSTAYALSDLEHYEVAVCADPAVPMAIITDFNQIAKANFNSSVRDDGKMVIQCENMGCYVKKDSLIKIEDDEDDNTQVTVLDEWENETHPDKNGKTEGIRTTKTGGGDMLSVMEGEKPKNYNEVEAGRQRGQAIDVPVIKDKFMEKKEMMQAVEDLPDKEKVKKSIIFLEKYGYQVFTEDRNNGTGINDLQREIPEECNQLRTSQELPMGIQQANLNESQTFEQKVQALIREGKSRESAEKIVGSFVHKVEASSGSGGAGIGGANMTNGGTLTTSTGGANNPTHNNGCDCTCKDCKRNDKCNCCEKCKKKSKGLDISNTGGGGTTEQAFNQNPPNAQRLNNKSDDGEEEPPDSVPDEVELTEGGQEVFGEASRYANSVNHFKSANTIEVNKVHALLKLNKVRSRSAISVTGAPKPKNREYTQYNNTRSSNLSTPFGRKNRGNKEMEERERKSRARMFHTSHGDGETVLARKLPTTKEPTKPETTKVPYSKYRKRDETERSAELVNSLEKALSELIKQLPKKLSDHDREDTWEAPDEIDDEDRIHTDVHGLRIGENQKRHGNNSGAQRNSIVQGTGESGENAVTSGLGERLANTGNHGDGAGLMTTLSRRNANIMRSNKSLNELKKLHISGGVGSRGLGSAGGYTQGQGETTQITIVQPRPTDDRVEAKCIPKDDDFKNIKRSLDELTKVRSNRGAAPFGSDVGGTGLTSTAVADENTVYMDANGNKHSTQAEAEAVPARKRMNRRTARDARNAYRADTRQTIGQRTGNS